MSKQQTIYLVQTYTSNDGRECWNCREPWIVQAFSEKNDAISFIKKELDKYADVEVNAEGDVYGSEGYDGYYIIQKLEMNLPFSI